MINLKYSNTEEPFYDVEIDDQGNIMYYNEKGEFHRLNGPAIEWSDGSSSYWVNGKLHRLDGPARIFFGNDVEYWVNGNYLTKKEFDELTKHND